MLSPSSLLLLLVIVVILALIQYHDNDLQSVHTEDHQHQWSRQLQSGVNPFTTKTHNPAPPPSTLQGEPYQHQILTQRYVRQPNSTNDDTQMAAPTDDNSDPRSIAINGIVLSVSGFFIFMVIVSFIISRIKSKALQVDEDKKNEDEMAEIGLRMVSVGTQWDDHVIPLLPVAYSNTAGFQMTTGMVNNSTLKMDSKLPPIMLRKKLKVRKSADGSIRSAVEIKVDVSQFSSSSKGGIVSNSNNNNNNSNNNNSIGTMVVTLIRGIDIRSGNTLFGKADTYAIIRIGNVTKKSKVSVDGGKNPEWNEEFTFEVFNDKDDIEIDLFDKETVGEDRFQAHVKTTIEKWIKYGGFEGELGVTDRSNKAEGKISISATFTKV